MKKLILFSLIALVLAFVFSGCVSEKRKNESYAIIAYATKVFKSEHELRKMINYTSQEGNISGSFFLFSGSMSGSSSTEVKVSFAWKHPSGDYFNTTLNLDKIKVRLEESCTKPTVSFDYWSGFPSIAYLNDISYVNWSITSATITCNPSQWSVDVQLPYQSNSIKD
jgi:hypothetical protein